MLGRLVIYLLAGVPIGVATLLGIRVGLWDFADEVVSAYFVQGFAMAGMTSFLFTLIERAIAEFQRREGQLKAQIRTLQIEVDEIKRQRQVAEIVETEFFQDLQAKSTAMGERRASKRV